MPSLRRATPYELLDHFVALPVVVDGVPGTFVLDTGIGLTLLSESFAASVGCRPNGSSYIGRRMSGQEVSAPLGAVQSLTLGTTVREQLSVGIIDLAEGVDGFLSLEFFRDSPFTVDYRSQTIVMEDEDSLAERAAAGACADVRVDRDEHTLVVFMPFDIPGAGVIEVQVDMGSDVLILDDPLAPQVGIDLSDEGVRTVQGRDETDYQYTRHFTRIRGVVGPWQALSIRQRDPDVMFQKIIYDGLVGHSFLRNFTVTYDIPRSRIIFTT